ncbi:MAG: hypothetical protein AAF532_05720 [Planctomycetota bacterium]
MFRLGAFLVAVAFADAAASQDAKVWRGTWTDGSFGSGGVTLTITGRQGDTWRGTFKDNSGNRYPATLKVTGEGPSRRVRGTARGRKTYQIAGTLTATALEATYTPSRSGTMKLEASK